MEAIEALLARRTVREFDGTPIQAGDLETIVRAGASAPSAGNGQPCRFLAVEGRERIAGLLDASADAMFGEKKGSEEFTRFRAWSARYESAGCILVVFADLASLYPEYATHDAPLAGANVMVAATALGYGTAYLTDTVNEAGARAFLECGERWRPVCFIAVGKPVTIPQSPPKKSLGEIFWKDGIPCP